MEFNIVVSTNNVVFGRECFGPLKNVLEELLGLGFKCNIGGF